MIDNQWFKTITFATDGRGLIQVASGKEGWAIYCG